MAYNFSPKVPTDGLIFSIDSGNSKSFVSGSSTWYDMGKYGYTGNFTGTTTFDTSNGGSIQYAAANSYSTFSSNISQYFNGASNATLSYWFKMSIPTSYIFMAGFNATNNAAGSRFSMVISAGVAYFCAENTSLAYLNFNFSTQNTWVNMVQVYDGTQAVATNRLKVYLNGVLQPATVSGPATLSSNLSPFNIGVTTNSGNSNSINFGNMMGWNRSLTADEAMQCYNALRSRFGA